MAIEKLLVATADNHIVALDVEYQHEAEKERKKLQYQRFCESLNFTDFFNRYNSYLSSVSVSSFEKELFSQLDADNTNFLEVEIAHPNLDKQINNYKNDLNTNNYPAYIANQPNVLHFDNSIPDTEIPPLIKNLGFNIEAQDNVYDVVFDAAKNEYKVKDFNLRRATVYNKERKINFVRNHFRFPPQEFKTITKLIDSWNKAHQKWPFLNIYHFLPKITDAKARSLFKIYADEYSIVSHRVLSLKHELTHIKNEALLAGAGLKKSAKRLSVEDYYRLQVEDERSAYLSQVVNAANMYVQKGDPNDTSMFDGESRKLVKTLRTLPEDKRFELVRKPEVLLETAFNAFEQNHRKNYDAKQFKKNMNLEMQKVPLSAPLDNDRSEYFLYRSLLYRFRLYNPQTKAFEETNFTPYITSAQEVCINDDNRKNIIEPCEQKLTRRLAEYNRDVSRGKINADLVPLAKSIMLDNLHKPQFINKINGMDISLLAEERTSPTENTNNSTNSQPAEWSKNLKQYWSKFDGYNELSNNQNEYSFALNNSKVRYTDKDKVELSRDADYDVYVKLLKEPSNKNKPVIFKDTLTKEQALKLYVACVNNNRQMKGTLPKDFSQLRKLKGVPAEDLKKCQQSISRNQSAKNVYSPQIMNKKVNSGR